MKTQVRRRIRFCDLTHLSSPHNAACHLVHHQRKAVQRSGEHMLMLRIVLSIQRSSEEIAIAMHSLQGKAGAEDDPFSTNGATVNAVDSWQSFSVCASYGCWF
jgi:hypothetical protein